MQQCIIFVALLTAANMRRRTLWYAVRFTRMLHAVRRIGCFRATRYSVWIACDGAESCTPSPLLHCMPIVMQHLLQRTAQLAALLQLAVSSY
jgi:hypothetical protein